MRKGYTAKPCPGCGEKNERRSDSVCPECYGLLETGRKYRELYENLQENDSDMISVITPDNWCKPYYKTILGIYEEKNAEALAEIIVTLAKAISLPAPLVTTWGYRRHLENRLDFESDLSGTKGELFGRFEWKEARIFEKKVFDLLNKLNELIKKTTQEAYDGGVEIGKKSLFMLNAGKITLDEFESNK